MSVVDQAPQTRRPCSSLNPKLKALTSRNLQCGATAVPSGSQKQVVIGFAVLSSAHSTVSEGTGGLNNYLYSTILGGSLLEL